MMGFNASSSNRDGLLDRVLRRRFGGELRCCRRPGSVSHLVALSALVGLILPTSRAAEGVRGGTVRGLGVAGDVSIKSGEALASSKRGRQGDVGVGEMRRLQKMEGILNAEIDVVDTLQRVMQQEGGHGDKQLIATPEERHRKRGAGNQCHDLANLERSEACTIAKESCKPPNGLFNYMEMSYCVVPSKIFNAIILIAWLVVLFMWITSMVDFLVPSLACMAQACGLKESVAGVTFLALGNGSSDIFSLCAATVSSSRGMELTLGEIFGNGMFVFAFTSGIVAILYPFSVDPAEHTRDCLSYLAAILILSLMMSDGIITAVEGLFLILAYSAYVVLVLNFDTVRKSLGLSGPKHEEVAASDDEAKGEQQMLLSSDRYAVYVARIDPKDHTHIQQLSDFLHPVPADFEYLTNGEKVIEVVKMPVVLLLKLTVPVVDAGLHNSGWCRPIASIQVAVLPVMVAAFLYLHSLPGWMKAPATMGLVFVGSLLFGVGLGALVFHTTANDEPPKYHNLLAFLGFFVAILWIYATSEELVNVILAFGMVFDVGRTVLGITILAIGVGMQDLITNVGVAHAGMTRMAISACVGAPLLNMYFAMGISAVAGNALVVSPYPIAMTVHLFVCISFLVVSVITAMALLSYSNFEGGYVYGATMISLYAAFLITSIFFEIYIDEDDWGFGLARLIG